MNVQVVRAIGELLIKACAPPAVLTLDVNVASMSVAPQAAPPQAAPPRAEPTVTLWASDLSAYMGLESSFMNRKRALGGVWRRTNEVQFRAVQAHWKANGCMLAGEPAVRHMHDPFPGVATAEDVRAFCRTHGPADITRLYKAKGRLFEDALVARFEAQCGTAVGCRHAAVTWRGDTTVHGQCAAPRGEFTAVRPAGAITDPGPWAIIGEIDGCLADGSAIVEIKLRLQELREHIATRDYMQIQAYLHLFNMPQAHYVQGLFGTEQLLVKTVERCPAEWQTVIVPALCDFVCDVRRLLRGADEDAALRSAVLQECNADPIPAREFVVEVPMLRPLPTNVWTPVRSPVVDPPISIQRAPAPPPPPMSNLAVLAHASSTLAKDVEDVRDDVDAAETSTDDDMPFLPLLMKKSAVGKKPQMAKSLPRGMAHDVMHMFDTRTSSRAYNLRSNVSTQRTRRRKRSHS